MVPKDASRSTPGRPKGEKLPEPSEVEDVTLEASGPGTDHPTH